MPERASERMRAIAILSSGPVATFVAELSVYCCSGGAELKYGSVTSFSAGL